jgi:hypothetical protein
MATTVKPDKNAPELFEDESEKRDDRPHKVRSTSSSANKVLMESTDPREVKKFVEQNFPRKHHEAEDSDVYVEHPDGSKHSYNAGDGEDGWSDYKTAREREDER